jgi:hypothetical protein
MRGRGVRIERARGGGLVHLGEREYATLRNASRGGEGAGSRRGARPTSQRRDAQAGTRALDAATSGVSRRISNADL